MRQVFEAKDTTFRSHTFARRRKNRPSSGVLNQRGFSKPTPSLPGCASDGGSRECEGEDTFVSLTTIGHVSVHQSGELTGDSESEAY